MRGHLHPRPWRKLEAPLLELLEGDPRREESRPRQAGATDHRHLTTHDPAERRVLRLRYERDYEARKFLIRTAKRTSKRTRSTVRKPKYASRVRTEIRVSTEQLATELVPEAPFKTGAEPVTKTDGP